MRISLLTPDFSQNSLGRTYLLAKILSNHYDVEIIGPLFGKEIWKPLKNAELSFKPVRLSYPLEFLLFSKKSINRIKGDVIYAIKPHISSFGIGILAKLAQKRPLILDIDDWELGHWVEKSFLRCLLSGIRWINKPFSYFPNILAEHLIPYADAITVSSSFLQNKYGGIRIPHVRSASNINFHNCEEIKEKYCNPGDKVIMFLGTPQPYKGVKELIEVFKEIDRKNVCLMIIGVGKSDSNSREILKCARDDRRIKILSKIPFNDVPKFLSIADIVVVPQKDTPFTRAQIPAKLFDAMAMGSPIIATKISDIPEILKECAILIPPNNTKELKNAIEYLLSHEKIAKELGKKAHQRFVEDFSIKRFEPLLVSVIRSVIEKQ